MTPAHRTVKLLLTQRDLTFSDLAQRSGLTQTTIHNTLSGRTSSAKARQAITNALGDQVFEGVVPTEIRQLYRADVIIAFPGHPELAALWGRDFPDSVRVSGEQISFVQDTVFNFRIGTRTTRKQQH